MTRKLRLALGATVLAMVTAACGGVGGGSGDDDTIKIAIIPPSSGALAQFGTDAARAWQLAVDMVNEDGGIDGKQVELIEKSTDATPANTLRAAREAVTRDGAQFIGAVMTSTEHGALNQQLESLGVLSFNGLGKDDGLVGEQCSPNAFAIVQRTETDINALAESIDEMPGEDWAIQAVDFSTGHTSAEIFTEAAEGAGKNIVLEQFSPLDTTDFGTYITRMQNSDADALFAVVYGADGIAFVQQADQFNLTDQFDTVLGFNMVSEPLFETLGDSILGFYNNVGYDIAEDNELNQEFVAAYEEEYGEKPYYVPADNFLAAQTLFAGIREAGSGDPEEVAEALKDLTFDSIVGEVTLRGADNQLIRPSYLGRVVEDPDGPGGLAFEIINAAPGDVITPDPNPACDI